jgi:hypothetical protein
MHLSKACSKLNALSLRSKKNWCVVKACTNISVFELGLLVKALTPWKMVIDYHPENEKHTSFLVIYIAKLAPYSNR